MAYRSTEPARQRHRREVHPTHWLISTQVWSAGLAPIKFVEGSSLEKGKGGRIVVDEYLRAADRVFALGDCAASREDPLPPTAVAAEQQGAYLAKCFNTTYYKAGADGPMPAKPDPVRPSAMPFDFLEPLDGLWEASSEFRYVERGKMASMGMYGAAVWKSRGRRRRVDGVGHRNLISTQVGRRRGHDQIRDHARRRNINRCDGVRVVARRLPVEAGLGAEHDPDPDVLV